MSVTSMRSLVAVTSVGLWSYSMKWREAYYTGMRAGLIRDNRLEVGFAHFPLYAFRLFFSPETQLQSADRSFEIIAAC